MLPVMLIVMAFWGCGAAAQTENDFSIVIAPPTRPSKQAPALINARYFSGRFIFYFNGKVKSAEWNGVKQKLAPLEEGAAAVVHAGPDTRRYPLRNLLKVMGAGGKQKAYTVTFVPMYAPRAKYPTVARPLPRQRPPQIREVATAPSSSLTVKNGRSPLRLGSFEVMAFISVPKDGNTAFAPLAAWTPQWHVDSRTTISLRVGFSPMKTLTQGFFVATDYMAELGIRRERWYPYLGGGVQIWHQRLGANPVGTIGVRYFHARLRDKSQAWLMAAYSAYLPPSEWIHQLRFGMGFEI